MFSPAQRWTLPCVLLAALAFSCADGDDGDASSFSGGSYPQPTQTQTTPMTTPMGTTGATTGETQGDEDNESTDPAVTTGSSDPDPTNSDPSTSGPDPSMTNPDPSMTNPDPSDATTAPMTTDPDPSSTTSMTTMTTMPMTTMPMTTDPPDQDPQPTGGLYAECLEPAECDAGLSCLTVTDNMTMMVYDGFCTKVCTTVANCGAAPNAPAVQKCVPFQDTPQAVSLCLLECVNTDGCPLGMECTAVTNPNMTMGNYCI